MIKRVVVNIMQSFAPAFIVVCVLLCLSLSCTFPLYKARPNDLTELFNRSLNCVGANRAKKMTPDNQALESQDFPESIQQAEAAKRKLSGEDLRQYEQLVIMKKYPYLDLRDFELKFGPAVKKEHAKYRDAEMAGASDCKLTDDGPRVEIFSRGISGFAIPKSPANAVKSVQEGRRDDSKDNVKMRENSRAWNSLKDFVGNDCTEE